MQDIEILTELQLNKLLDGTQNVKVYGTHNNGVIGIGNGANSENIEAILTHEEIHSTLTTLFNEGVSFRFYRDLYYNFEYCKKGIFKGLSTLREALFTLFEGTTFI